MCGFCKAKAVHDPEPPSGRLDARARTPGPGGCSSASGTRSEARLKPGCPDGCDVQTLLKTARFFIQQASRRKKDGKRIGKMKEIRKEIRSKKRRREEGGGKGPHAEPGAGGNSREGTRGHQEEPHAHTCLTVIVTTILRANSKPRIP